MPERLPHALNNLDNELTPSPIDNRGVYFEHPLLPDKVIRWDRHTVDERVALPYFKQYFSDLEERYHIPNVHPTYVMSEVPFPETVRRLGMQPLNMDVITINDKVDDAVSVDELLSGDSISPEMLYEFDILSQRFVSHLRDVYRYGGLYSIEINGYSQYVYSDAMPEGQKLILVDVEPIAVYFEPQPFERLPGSAPMHIIELLAEIAEEVIDLEVKTGREMAVSSKLIELVQEIDANTISSVEEAKLRIEVALRSHMKEYLDLPMTYREDGTGLLDNDYTLESSIALNTAIEKGYLS